MAVDSIFLKAFFKISKDKPREKSLLHIWYFFVESKENCCDDLHWMYPLSIPINPAKSIKVFFNPRYESDSHMMNWDFYYFHKSTNNIRVSWRETNRNRDFLGWNINSVVYLNLGVNYLISVILNQHHRYRILQVHYLQCWCNWIVYVRRWNE